MIKKRPVTRMDEPTYPQSPRDEMGRRSFLTMLGIGAAGVTIIGSCGPDEPGHGTRDPRDRLGGTEPSPHPPVVPLAGVPRRPDPLDTDAQPANPEMRVLPKMVVPGLIDNQARPTDPLSAGVPHSLLLRDRTRIGYVLYLSFDGPQARSAIVERTSSLLENVDVHLLATADRGSVSDTRAVSRLRESVRPVVEATFLGTSGTHFVDLEITSVNEEHRKRGKVAPARPKGGIGRVNGKDDPFEGLDL